jgi:glycogen phosphorylase
MARRTKDRDGAPASFPAGEAARLLAHYGCGPIRFSGTHDGLYERHLLFDDVVDPAEAGDRDRFVAVARAVRDVLAQRWVLTERTYAERNPKRVYYLSMEYLLGRCLSSNVLNLLLEMVLQRMAGEKDLDLRRLVEEEPDAGLGNGGLGRLAACFLDSMATLQLPAMGYGLRYEYGMFRQALRDGWQVEQPDHWLRQPDPWEVARPAERVEIRVHWRYEIERGTLRAIPGEPSILHGIPFDRPVVGYGGRNVNTLRLWAASVPGDFDLRAFDEGDFVGAVAATLAAESITRVLYPDDSTAAGRALRFMQEYFLVACSLADLIRRFQRGNADWRDLPEKAAVQLNDTHPALAVPELMRILLDEARLGWDEAWDLAVRTLAYTNHTLLPEALEHWPREWFARLLPRHLEIILEINRRLLDGIRARHPGDEGRVQRVSLVEEGPVPRIRMANLAVVGSHSTNGVAVIHSRLLRTRLLPDLAGIFPERFGNKTNGVTPRRWLRLCNPALSRVLQDAIGDRWITDLSELARLRPLAEDGAFREAVAAAKREAKVRFVDALRDAGGPALDPDTVFDCQVKRIHEYKRQLLNALRVVMLYDRLRRDPSTRMEPRTFLFAGKAAPAYRVAKLVIKLLNDLAGTLAVDPEIRDRLRVVFLPEYNVSMAERLIPAADLSNQISTAGYEASGTSNMKFMMNGALTLGTRDGATIEMAEEAGEENLFLFGLTAAEVESGRAGYDPAWHCQHDEGIRSAVDLLLGGHFSRHEPGILEPLRPVLMGRGEPYMHLADLRSYLEASDQAGRVHEDRAEWGRRVVRNLAAAGRFSSDRAISEYAKEIWHAAPCPVG